MEGTQCCDLHGMTLVPSPSQFLPLLTWFAYLFTDKYMFIRYWGCSESKVDKDSPDADDT